MSSKTSKAQKRHDTSREIFKSDNWQKTLGIITCKRLRDDPRDEFQRVVRLLGSASFKDLLASYQWKVAMTGGTYEAVQEELAQDGKALPAFQLAKSALGMIQLGNLVVHGYISAVLFFNDLEDYYSDSPQNLCLRRLCNEFGTPLLEDSTTIEYLIEHRFAPQARDREYSADDAQRYLDGDNCLSPADLGPKARADRSRETLAIISHDKKKMVMLNFCLRHMDEILQYRRVLTTGTTGARLRDQYESALNNLATRGSALDDQKKSWGWARQDNLQAFLRKKICRMASGPLGGDIQIGAKVIEGTCHRVIFFQDPQSAHPHQFDIRLIEKAIQDLETGALFATSEETAALIV